MNETAAQEKNVTEGISKVLEDANNHENVKQRVKTLVDNDSKSLRYIMQASYDDGVKWLIPDGEPPFTPKKEPDALLEDVALDIPKLLRYGPWEKHPRHKVEKLFISMLESLPKGDAALLVMIKDQKLKAKYKRLTKNVAKQYLMEVAGLEIK